MRLEDLRRLSSTLERAAGPQDVFMALRDRNLPEAARAAALASELRRLQAPVHPERFMGNPAAQDLAQELMGRLQALYEAALAGLADAGASAPVASAATRSIAPAQPASRPPEARRGPEFTGFEVVVGANHYRLATHVGSGDLAEIYRGTCVAGEHAGAEVAAKVAAERADNSFIAAEVQALRVLRQGEAAQVRLLPRLLEVFHGGEGEAGVVLGWAEGLTGEALRARFPAGVPPEHVIWIGRRLLSVVGHAHSLGVVHANIEPAHVIVRPRDHHVTLIDWCYSVIEPARSGQGFRVYNPDYSAPEVREKRRPSPTADLYSIGRCLLFLLGGALDDGTMPDSVPARLQRFIHYLTRASPLQRAQDAWEMFAELDRTREAIYGPHVFRELVL